MQEIISVFSHPMIKKLDSELVKIFENAPHLPKKVVDVLVKVLPYLALISGLVLISGGLRSVFGARSFLNTFVFWKTISPIYFYTIGLLQIIAGAVSVAAYQPLKNKKLEGWFALLGLTILELLMNVISVIFLNNGIFGLLLGLLISLYFIYEIKGSYLPNKIVAKKIKKLKNDLSRHN